MRKKNKIAAKCFQSQWRLYLKHDIAGVAPRCQEIRSIHSDGRKGHWSSMQFTRKYILGKVFLEIYIRKYRSGNGTKLQALRRQERSLIFVIFKSFLEYYKDQWPFLPSECLAFSRTVFVFGKIFKRMIYIENDIHWITDVWFSKINSYKWLLPIIAFTLEDQRWGILGETANSLRNALNPFLSKMLLLPLLVWLPGQLSEQSAY